MSSGSPQRALRKLLTESGTNDGRPYSPLQKSGPVQRDRCTKISQLDLASLRRLFRVLDSIHEITSFADLGVRIALQDVRERNLFTVDLVRQLLVLLQFRAVQRCADKGALAA